jgi:hypothetical protein
MPAVSKTILAVLVGFIFTFGFAVPSAAIAKDQHKLCGVSTATKVQGCSKLVAKTPAKLPAKKPGKAGDKGVSPGAILLLQLLL